MKIGVLALQGAFAEHIKMLAGLGVTAVELRLPGKLSDLYGLIIPGGESTTIGKLARMYNFMEPLRAFAAEKAMWGTCAGMIFMAKEIEATSSGKDQPLLAVMYVDKRLEGIQAVQTLSRLNRMAPGKEATFVLDFVNERDAILGLIQAFEALSDPAIPPDKRQAMLANGISIAMNTTAFGLIVAIPAMAFYRHFRRKIEALVVDMEQQAIKLVEIVHGDRK